jgi:hypothetical protein
MQSIMGDAAEKAESSHLIYNGRSEKRGASGSSEASRHRGNS